MRVGLVLGGGGVMGGAWMLGCLRALATKTGWDPRRADHLVGTSVGALVAGAASRLYLPSWMRGQQLPEAVAASCAIPAIYRPERIRDRRYVDGGLYSCSNLDLLAERQLDLVICLNPMSSPGVLTGRANPLDRVIALAQQAAHRRLEREAAMVEASGSHVVVLEPGPEDLQAMGRNLMSRRRIQNVMEVAFHSTAAKLDQEDLPSLDDAFRAGGSNLWDRPRSAAASQFRR